MTTPQFNGWQCRCGSRNPPHARFCSYCGASFPSRAAPQAPSPQVVNPSPSAQTTFATVGLIGLVLVGLLVVGSWSVGARDEKQARAETNFRATMEAAATQSGYSPLRVQEFIAGRPVIAVSEAWYRAGPRSKEKVVEATARTWWAARREAGFSESEAVEGLEFYDASSNHVAQWSALTGTHVYR